MGPTIRDNSSNSGATPYDAGCYYSVRVLWGSAEIFIIACAYITTLCTLNATRGQTYKPHPIEFLSTHKAWRAYNKTWFLVDNMQKRLEILMVSPVYCSL